MKKWVLAGIGYLLVVIIAYSVYSYITTPEVATEGETEQGVHDDHGDHGDHHGDSEQDSHGDGHGDHNVSGESEVNVEVEVIDSNIQINLTDLQGQPVDDLEINHEKLLHLIIVDEHLDQYLHLHPEKVGAGIYAIEQQLTEGSYKAFIDIKPKGKAYSVQPLSFIIGDAEESHQHGDLEVDTEFQKTINSVTTNLEISSFKAQEEVTLAFRFPVDIEIEPYLGAMGHVVILDEVANEYIHVHPVNDDETVFETVFPHAGIYKVWGEFQIEGQVITYPFVVEIK